MTSLTPCTILNPPEGENSTLPPPATPRPARFEQYNLRKRLKILLVVWLISVGISVAGTKFLFPYFLHRHPIPIVWTSLIITLLVSLGVYGTVIAIVLRYKFFNHKKKIERRQKLFCHGIPAMATVTFIGMTHNPKTKACCRIVRWSYTAEGMESVGVTPSVELPDAAVDDTFWVLYEKECPWFVRRWELFDASGNLRSHDELPWSPKVDTVFLE